MVVVLSTIIGNNLKQIPVFDKSKRYENKEDPTTKQRKSYNVQVYIYKGILKFLCFLKEISYVFFACFFCKSNFI